MWNPFKRKLPTVRRAAEPVRDNPRSEQEREVRTMVERERRRSLRVRQGLGAITVAMVASNLILALALYGAYPLIRLVPLIVQARKDGSTYAEPLMSLMNVEDVQEPVKRATLWQYTMFREGFSADTAQFRYNYVVALSSGDVGDAFTQWYNFPNPESPQVKYGKNHGIVTIIFDNADFTSDPFVYQVSFYREVKLPGMLPSRSHWTAFVHYKMMQLIPAIERGTINPAAIKVTGYSVQETDDPGNKS
jgi:type IV secretion system protein VirB8